MGAIYRSSQQIVTEMKKECHGLSGDLQFPLQAISPGSFVGRGFSRDIKAKEKTGFSPWIMK